MEAITKNKTNVHRHHGYYNSAMIVQVTKMDLFSQAVTRVHIQPNAVIYFVKET